MGERNQRRRIVDALDDLTAELRLANRMKALSLGAATLEDESIKPDAAERTRARISRRNALRATVREGLGL